MTVLRLKKQEFSVPELLELFLTEKRLNGISPRTISDYRNTVLHLCRLHPDLLENPRGAVLSYLGRYDNASSYNLRLAYIKVFLDWLMGEGHLLVDRHPLYGIKKRRAHGRIVSIEEETLKKLLALPDRTRFSGLRDYALILLQLDTGIRPGEALSLRRKDFSPGELRIVIPGDAAKTRQPRVLPLSLVVSKAITELLNAHDSSWRDATIFPTCSGAPMLPSVWAQLFKMRYAAVLGVNITPYSLRHAFALTFLRNEGNTLALQRIMGHSTLIMTTRYVNFSDADLRAQHEKSSPLAGLAEEPRKRLGKLK